VCFDEPAAWMTHITAFEIQEYHSTPIVHFASFVDNSTQTSSGNLKSDREHIQWFGREG